MRIESFSVHYQCSIQEPVIINAYPSCNHLHHTCNWFHEHKGPTNSQVSILNLYFSRNILPHHAKTHVHLRPISSISSLDILTRNSYFYGWTTSTPSLTQSQNTTLNYPQTLGINILFKEYDGLDTQPCPKQWVHTLDQCSIAALNSFMGASYHIERSPLVFRAIERTVFNIIGASVMN